MKPITRGDIFYAYLNPVVGSEQGGRRPVLVIQNDVGNKFSPTIVIVPISGKIKKNTLPTHVKIPLHTGLKVESLALVEQIRTIDRSRFGEYIGRINAKVQTRIDYALAVCVGIGNRHSNKEDMFTLCLCRRCESDFWDSGCVLVKKGWQKEKRLCDFCEARNGLIFGIFNGSSLTVPPQVKNTIAQVPKIRPSTESGLG